MAWLLRYDLHAGPQTVRHDRWTGTSYVLSQGAAWRKVGEKEASKSAGAAPTRPACARTDWPQMERELLEQGQISLAEILRAKEAFIAECGPIR